MNEQKTSTRKPYVTPRLQEQGKVATVTRQITPTTTPPSSGLGEFDEF